MMPVHERMLSEALIYQRDMAAEWLDRFKRECRRIYLFGAGLAGQCYKYTLEKHGVVVHGFCDNSVQKIGTTIDSVPIVSFDEMVRDQDKFVVISSANAYMELVEQCESGGVEQSEICCIDWLWYEADDKKAVTSRIGDLCFAYESCVDDASRSVYLNCLLNRLSRDRRHYKNVKTGGLMYFDSEVMDFSRGGEVFVDCGAAYGDTVQQFMNLIGGKAYAFEPEKSEFKKLLINTGGMSNVVCYNAGVGAEAGAGAFNSDSFGMGGTFDESGKESALIQTIDDALPEPPTFIKMDIQGFEMNALRGASKTIGEVKPKMAICVYHKTSDFLDIPRFVLSLRPDYQLHFRHYRDDTGDTLAYFV